MRLLVLQLSDIHIANESDAVLPRARKIVEAIRNVDYELDLCVVAITGDIAFSGSEDEYVLALEFLGALTSQLRTDLNQTPPVKVVMVPGNHDCDFSRKLMARDLLVGTIVDKLPKVDGSTIEVCTEVQTAFFDFRDLETDGLDASSNRLYYQYTFEHQKERVLFRCYNTAWLSQLHEKPAGLFFPVEMIPNASADLVFSLFHHPYNWLTPNNARSFRKRVEEVSDIILSGHEHDFTQRMQVARSGEVNLYIEGSVLQDSHDPQSSGFNILLVDTKSRRQKVAHYQWDDSRYVEGSPTTGWTEYQVNRVRSTRDFELKDKFRVRLDDLGITLSHSVKGQVALSEIFVYPDLREITLLRREVSPILPSEEVIQWISEGQHLLISGPEKSGKTCLAKKLFVDCRRSGFVPILLDGNEARLHGDERDYELFYRMFSDQYQADSDEPFKQLERSRRVLIVDNSHKISLRKTTTQSVLKQMTNFGGAVVLLANDVAQLVSEIVGRGDMAEESVTFRHLRIQQCGHVRRNELAERWLALDPSVAADGQQFARKLVEVKRMTDTVIGKNLVPAYPVFILPMLQAHEHSQQVNLNASTYGYFYELLIRRALVEGSSREDFDIKLGYLSFVAYTAFSQDAKELTEPVLRKIHAEYEQIYGIEVPFVEMQNDLVRSQLFELVGGVYRFRYSYVYYYFVANYLGGAITDPAAESQVKGLIIKLCERLHQEDSANIMLFLAHLSKHPFIVEQMLKSAESVFPEFERVELRQGILPPEVVDSSLRQIVYEEQPTEDSRKHYLKRLDKLEESEKSEERESMDEAFAEVDAYLRRFSVAYKTLQILGQLVKNFPGSMKELQKRQIVDACYGIGLRTLGALLKGIELNKEEVMRSIIDVLRQDDPNLANEVLSRKARDSLYGLIHMVSYATVKRIGHAVGSPALAKVHDALLEASDAPSVALVHASVRLDQFSRDFPQDEVERLGVALKDNVLSLGILRSMVVNHFYLFVENYALKQRICDKLGISYKRLQRTDPKARLVSGKKSK
jgi:predicted MPP superfamily phosphohydrolase